MRHEPIKIDVLQGSPQWHKWRLNTLTASKIPVIMGESPYKTRYQLWEEMVGLGETQQQSEAMKRGVVLEPHVRNYVSRKLETEFQPCVYQHPKIAYFGASLDGISSDGKTVIEIKTANKLDHELAKFGMIPDKYVGQVNGIMEVMGLDTMLYISNHGAILESGELKDLGDTVIVPIVRNMGYVTSMMERLHQFWKHVKDFIPPSLDNKDFVQNESEDWKTKAERYKQLDDAIKDLEKEKDAVKNDLLLMTGGQSTIGGGIRVCKIVEKGRVNYNSIPELIGINLDAYRKEPITKWRFT